MDDFIAKWYPRYEITQKPYRRQVCNAMLEEYHDLRLAQIMLNRGEDEAFWADEVLRAKRVIRSYIKKTSEQPYVCIKSDFDSAVYKYEVGPVTDKSAKQVKHFCAQLWRNPPCSPYDCTGKVFTTGIHYGVLHGTWYVWEYVSIDV